MLKKICNLLMTIIIVLLFVLAGILVGPKLFGCNTYAVISGSMEPEIPVGSIVCSQKVEFADLKENDIISYQVSSDTIVTHRIVSIDNEKKQVITKGDANNVNDANPVPSSNIIGKVVFSLPLIGYISIHMQSMLGIVIICAIVFILILLNYLPDIFEKNED